MPLRAPAVPIDDVRRWWITVENDDFTYSVDVVVSGRERLMNTNPEAYRQLLAVRFDAAVRKLREEFLKHA